MDFYPRGPFSGSGGRNPAVGWNRGPEGWIRPICGWVLFRFRAGVVGMGGKSVKKGHFWGNYAVVWAFLGSGKGLGGGSLGGSWTGVKFLGVWGAKISTGGKKPVKMALFRVFAYRGRQKRLFGHFGPLFGVGTPSGAYWDPLRGLLGPPPGHLGTPSGAFWDPPIGLLDPLERSIWGQFGGILGPGTVASPIRDGWGQFDRKEPTVVILSGPVISHIFRLSNQLARHDIRS